MRKLVSLTLLVSPLTLLVSLILFNAAALQAGVGPTHRVHIKVPVAIGAAGALIALGAAVPAVRHAAKNVVIQPAKATARIAAAVGRTAAGRPAPKPTPAP